MQSTNRTLWQNLIQKLVARRSIYPKNIHSENVTTYSSKTRGSGAGGSGLPWCLDGGISGVSTGAVLRGKLVHCSRLQTSSCGSWAYVKVLCATQYPLKNSFSA